MHMYGCIYMYIIIIIYIMKIIYWYAIIVIVLNYSFFYLNNIFQMWLHFLFNFYFCIRLSNCLFFIIIYSNNNISRIIELDNIFRMVNIYNNSFGWLNN